MIINVGIVDDKAVNRNTVKKKLESYSEVSIILEAGNGKDFLDQLKELAEDKRPHIVLMDLDMPIMDGIDTIKIGSATYPKIKFIVLTVFEDSERIFEAIKAGANGYLLKDDKAINIMEAISNVIDFNGVPMSPIIARKAMELMLGKKPTNSDASATTQLGLTQRETEILKELASGATYNAIGEKLFISPLTVRKHVANLYEKLHVSNRTQIINIAQKNNLI
ncbi:MAG: response regulator transcription factor [Sphingobacteriaceae bacterium]|nr:response regulator transcription factor [Sphingobacteriaceae bacterium]